MAHLVIETAFSDDEHALATISEPSVPGEAAARTGQLATRTEVYITHIKPGEVAAVMGQIAALGSKHRISALASGQAMVFGAAAAK